MNRLAPQPRASQPPPQAIILAAGKGKRMGGDLPKVLHPVADKPMLWWVVQACKAVGVTRCIVVIGYKAAQVKAAMADEPICHFVEQTEQLGTAHATRITEPLFENQPPTDIFVLAGDGPLIRPQTLARLLEIHRRAATPSAAATLATAVLDDPTGYGRVVRTADGAFEAIVEQKDASEAQLAIHEVNPSYYCLRSDVLFPALAQVSNNNSQGEYYLTDVPGMLKNQGKTVVVVDAVPPGDVLSINTPRQLAQVDQILRQRTANSGAPLEKP